MRRMDGTRFSLWTGGALRLMVLALAVMGLIRAAPVEATAAFARQTGEPCSACHMQSYGPYLTPYGRLFKLNAFTAGHAAKLPDIVNAFSFQTIGSFTHTQEDQPGGAGSGFSGNNNATNDWNAIYYTGRVTDKIGAYLQLNFNPQVTENISLAMAEIRYADHTDLAGSNLIYGISANNGPTMSDTWMTVPEWMYPYNTSQLAPQPTAQPLMMQLMGFTAGSSAYAMWDNHVYVEAGAYTSMASNMANGLGVFSRSNPLIDGGAPYYRVFLQHITGPHVLMVGTYGMQANIYPQYNKSFGTNSVTDWNVDSNYMYMLDDDNMLMFMARWTRDQYTNSALGNAEDSVFAEIAGSRQTRIAGGGVHRIAGNARQYVTNMMIMGMYTFRQTYTLTFSYNRTGGSGDRVLYQPAPISGSRNGLPNSENFQVQFDYVPFGKGESPLDPYLNLRLSLQYTAWTVFNGAANNYDGYGRNAAANNTLFLVGNLMW